MRQFLVALPLLGFSAASGAVTPFMAAAVPSGSVQVQLCPTEVVTPNSPRLVTFGLPLPRGSLTAAQLNTVRLTKNGVEQLLFVDQLTPWRHRSLPALDGTSVRVARLQLDYSFAGAACETVTVSWGGAVRTQNRPSLVSPRSAWHVVSSGTFLAADGVSEPDVFAVLPRDWLAKGVLKGVQNLPFDASITDARDNPSTMDATEHWPGYTELDHALKNNFFALINEDDPLVTAANQCHYKAVGEYEPWLYDRSATMFVLYFRGASFKALREAVRASDFYANHLSATGYFNLRDDDSKYSYAENLAYTVWLTGDTTQLSHLPAVLAAHDTFPDQWTTSRNFWTERHAAFKLLANAIAYELNGGTTQRDKVNLLITHLIDHQNGAGGVIPHPANFVDGGFYHTGAQHDYDWGDADYGGSSWMSVLLVDALLRSYGSAEDLPTANMIRRLGSFLRATTIDTLNHSYDNYEDTLALPRYGMLLDGTDGQVNYEDVEHALDVASGLAWAAYFADLTGQHDATLRARATDLYFSYDTGVNFWVRPGGPAAGLTAYRVAPPRKWGWEHRVSAGFGWAMNATSDTIFANGFE